MHESADATTKNMNSLIIDWETTGLGDFRKLANDPCQPRPVQLGAILYGHDRKVRGELNLIVKPNGWTIPDEAVRVHGITTEMAHDLGLPLATVLDCYEELVKKADLVGSHNWQYDDLVTDTAAVIIGKVLFEPRSTYCTKIAMVDYCKIPGAYGYKWPTLAQAHQHAFGIGFEGAHDAMADVRAAARVYFWIREQETKKANEQQRTTNASPAA